MKVINKTDNRVLIEHNNFRSMVTQELYRQFEEGILSPEELVEVGLPVSVQWSDFISLSATPEDIEATLHQRGIHTLEDLLKSSQAVSGAVLATIGLTASSIYNAVKNSQQKQLGGE
jgi:hypothetical protein